jgi:hypothetical protein
MRTLFFAQVAFCDLIFRRRAALDRLGERLLETSVTNHHRLGKHCSIFDQLLLG